MHGHGKIIYILNILKSIQAKKTNGHSSYVLDKLVLIYVWVKWHNRYKKQENNNKHAFHAENIALCIWKKPLKLYNVKFTCVGMKNILKFPFWPKHVIRAATTLPSNSTEKAHNTPTPTQPFSFVL